MRAYLRLRAYPALERTLATNPSCGLAYVPVRARPNRVCEPIRVPMGGSRLLEAL